MSAIINNLVRSLRVKPTRPRRPDAWGGPGDGRERALAKHVLASTAPGDLDGVIAAIDEFASHQRWLMNVGPEKGAILDAAVRRCQPMRLLELGTYCGYSALRIARVMPAGAHLWSIERSAADAAIARRIWKHAGVDTRVSCVIGWFGDAGVTLRRLAIEHDFAPGSLDFVFIDHAKDRYLADLRHLLDRNWLRPDATVVADNIKFPGAPDYLAYMREQEGNRWRTTEYETHLEYRPEVADLVLESRYLGRV